MEVYILKSIACLGVLFIFYKLALENTALHTTKRVYLLGSLVISIIIPFITFTQYVAVAPVSQMVSENFVVPVFETQELTKDPINYSLYILWTLYSLGVLFFALRFTKNLISLVKKIRKNPIYKEQSFLYVLLQLPVTPHSFFNYIFFDKEAFEAGNIPKEVIIHEQAHVNQKHSWDILFFEIIQIVFWFNPLLYFFKRSIKMNHEFLADRTVLQTGAPLSKYQSILLDFSSKSSVPAMAHSINYSSIKKRFTIMKTHTSKRAALLKGLLVLPLLAVLVYGFSSTQIIEKTENQNQINQPPTFEEQISSNTNPKKFFIRFEENKATFNGVNISINDIAKNFDESTKSWTEQDFLNNQNSQEILAHTSYDFLNDSEFLDDVNKQFSNTNYAKKTGRLFLLPSQWHSTTIKMFTIPRLKEINANYYWEGKKTTLSEIELLLEKDQMLTLKMSHLFDNRQPVVQFEISKTKQIENKSFLLQIERSKLKFNGASVELKNLANTIDIYTKDWEETDYTETRPNVLIASTPKAFLDKVDSEFRKTNFSKANGGMGIIPPPPPTTKKVTMGEESVIPPPPPIPPTSKMMLKGEKSNIPPPPPPPISMGDVTKKYEYSYVLYVNGESIYLNGKVVSLSKFAKAMDNHTKNWPDSAYKFYGVSTKKENVSDAFIDKLNREYRKTKLASMSSNEDPYLFSTFEMETPPPPPISSTNPLDHIIRMAKENAAFFYEDKPISSDKAIALLKGNSSLNVSTEHFENSNPIVTISKEGIKN